MKILFISPEGDGFSLALALQRDGHEVRVHCKDKKFQYSMSGILQKLPSYRSSLPWADLVLVDMVGSGKLERELKRAKVPFIGANLFADALELDRGKQMTLFNRAGIPLPPTYNYSSPKEARKTLAMWNSPGYVVKPSGNLATASTRVCPTIEEFEWALEQFAADQELVVQKIVNGVEVSTEGWFDGKDWVHFNHTFEEKRFLPDSGQNTGCMGNIVTEGRGFSPLCQELVKLEPFLKAADYRGPVDLNCIVSGEEIYALEATPRFGYDAIEALWAMSEGFGDFLVEVAKGNGRPLNLRESFGAAVRLSLPPYPMAEPDREDRGRPVVVNSSEERNILWSDTYQDGNKMLSAGADGVIAKAVGADSSLKGVREKVYKAVHAVSSPDLQYRNDIGKRVQRELDKLESFGVI